MHLSSFASSLVVVFAIAGLALACSSTASGTSGGTSSGTSSSGGGGKGLFGGLAGGGSSSGTTSSGGTSSGASSGTAPSSTSSGGTSCAPQAGDDACSACMRSKCCSAVTGCFVTTPACGQLLDCAGGCASNDDACLSSCLNRYQAGQNAFSTLYSCGQSNCSSPCQLTSTSSGGSSGPTPPPGG